MGDTKSPRQWKRLRPNASDHCTEHEGLVFARVSRGGGGGVVLIGGGRLSIKTYLE